MAPAVDRPRSYRQNLPEILQLARAGKCLQLRFDPNDQWNSYLSVIAEKAAGTVSVLDRFHIMSQMSKVIDAVRANEAKELKIKGKEPILKGSRGEHLKSPRDS